MKRIMVISITTTLAFAIGVAYAMEGSRVLNNGATDFSGRTYDSLSDISLAALDTGAAYVESSEAGGMRPADSIGVSNGATDFSGRTYDSLSDIGFATPGVMDAPSVESSHAGGPRAEEPGLELSNGATDFSGRTYDTLSDINR